MDWAQILNWINVPIFHIGQTPVTLGGIGSAFFILFASVVVSKFLQKILSSRLEKSLGLHPSIAYALKRTIHYIVIFVGIILAMQCLGLQIGSLAVLVGFLGVGIGLGLQNITSNFISGLILLFERPIGLRDLVSVTDGSHEVIGTVTVIGLRATHVKTLDNIVLIIPNSQFVENHVTNWSHGDPTVRLHAPVGVSYGSDLKLVTESLLKVAAEHPKVLSYPKPEVRFLGFGDSSLDLDLLIWSDEPDRQFQVTSEINFAIDAIFREVGVTIPFPQRDVHVKTPQGL